MPVSKTAQKILNASREQTRQERKWKKEYHAQAENLRTQIQVLAQKLYRSEEEVTRLRGILSELGEKFPRVWNSAILEKIRNASGKKLE